MRKLLVFLWLAVWLYLCLIPTLESGANSYSAWREAGCPQFGTGAPRAFCPRVPELWRGLLLWALTAPFLAWSLLRTPRPWPRRLTHFAWNQERPWLSLGTLLLCVMVLASIWLGAVRAPFAAAAISNYLALLPVAACGFGYRAVLLSAERTG